MAKKLVERSAVVAAVMAGIEVNFDRADRVTTVSGPESRVTLTVLNGRREIAQRFHVFVVEEPQ